MRLRLGLRLRLSVRRPVPVRRQLRLTGATDTTDTTEGLGPVTGPRPSVVSSRLLLRRPRHVPPEVRSGPEAASLVL
ncbi:hypothetical protein BJY27_005552 [Streptomyces rapamycinicus]|uniref:Uncharacterized protein n=2 Tax=Streptomyces rapamycinicus TaxID=1226757 RepID=A0A3L8RJC6_STRRN|nr:hypothetical protein [Streptomyces rapamycinicus]RLV79926.1 hypothetical protein D3C57_116115 [Streptomyces rapamycinicus NRRL 5491]